ncbi:MAG: hypothetical protein ACYDD1_22705 [Caulobacteraceae bacterium]
MRRPTICKPHHSLSGEERAKIVKMREEGATWMAIGRVFRMQETRARLVYQRAKAAMAAELNAPVQG